MFLILGYFKWNFGKKIITHTRRIIPMTTYNESIYDSRFDFLCFFFLSYTIATKDKHRKKRTKHTRFIDLFMLVSSLWILNQLTKEHTSISSNENRLEWNVCLCSVALFFSLSSTYRVRIRIRWIHFFGATIFAFANVHIQHSICLSISFYRSMSITCTTCSVSEFRLLFKKKMNSIQQSVLNDYLPIVYRIPKLFILILWFRVLRFFSFTKI